MAWLPVVAGPEFSMREEKIRPPEMGEITRYVVVDGTEEFPFIGPLDWRVTVEADRHRLLLQPNDRAATIFVTFTRHSAVEGTALDVESWRADIKARFSGSQIIDEFTAYSGNLSGRGLDVKWMAPGAVPMCSRVSVFVSTSRTIEFCLTTRSDRFPMFRSAFAALVRSFQESGKPVRRVVKP